MRIHRGGPDDARAAAALYMRSRGAAETAGAIPPGLHGEEDVAGHMATRQELWLAGDVGLLVLQDDWVDHLYVEPGATGRGIGSALLDIAKRERPEGLQLWTFQSNL